MSPDRKKVLLLCDSDRDDAIAGPSRNAIGTVGGAATTPAIPRGDAVGTVGSSTLAIPVPSGDTIGSVDGAALVFMIVMAVRGGIVPIIGICMAHGRECDGRNCQESKDGFVHGASS